MSWVALVGFGGVAGAVARHLVEATVIDEYRDTLAVNVAGSLLLGAVLGVPSGEAVVLAVAVGFCGAFTTFSTFALEIVQFAEGGEPWRAVGFALANLIGALAAVAIGAALGGLV
jgi:CrcB protein